MFIFIHLSNIPPYQLFFCSLHPSASQGHLHSYPSAVLCHSSDRVPISVPRPWGSADTQCRWPRAHPSSSASRDNLAHSHLGRPFPTGHPGKGHKPPCPRLPCGVRSARRALLSHPVPPCTCRPPRSGSAPPSPCPAQRGPQGDSGQSLPPSPAPIPRGTGHTASHSSLWFAADVPGRSGQPGEAGSPPCSQTAHEERRTPLCSESGTPQSPHVSPCAVRTLSGTGRGGRAGESSSRTFCGS